MKITGDDAQPVVDALNQYLSSFAKPSTNDEEANFLVDNKVCLQCGHTLGGVLGSFRWGIAWGEGTCIKCGWPCRAYHEPKDADGNIFNRPLEIILQYHPSQIISPAVGSAPKTNQVVKDQ